MKRVFQLLIIFVITLSFTVANAAYAYIWTVNGEYLTRGGDPILNGAAKWIESNEYSGGILILDNYNGGDIKVECRGTGMNQVFAVELRGNNTINSDEIGFLTTDKVVFIGDGTLTITAPVPISSVEYIDDVPLSKSQITIYGKKSKVEKEEAVVKEEAKEEVKEEKEEEKEEKEAAVESKTDDSEETVAPTKGINKYLYLVIIGIAVVGLFILGFKLLKKNKKRS